MNIILDTKEKIEQWLKNISINNYFIHDNLIVDVFEDVDLSLRNLTEIPLKFGIIKGDFNCYKNLLTSLVGSPTHVIGDYNCSENKLNNFLGISKKIEGSLNCSYNDIKSFEGLSEYISDDMYMFNNPIQSIDIECISPLLLGEFWFGNEDKTKIMMLDFLYDNDYNLRISAKELTYILKKYSLHDKLDNIINSQKQNNKKSKI